MMKTQNHQAKEAVRLRTKPIKNGNFSLYLDIYYQGVRKYEFLHLYLVPEQDREARSRNKQSLQLANSIRIRRMAELQKTLYEGSYRSPLHPADFLSFVDAFAATHRLAYRSLCSALKSHLISYKGTRIRFSDIDKDFLAGFHHYLRVAPARGNVSKRGQRLLSQGTQWNYFNVLSRLLNKATREGYLPSNPMHQLTPAERPGKAEPRKTFLTIQEVRRLAATPLSVRPEVRQAFLFSCLCGLRFSDVKRLRWSNLQTDSDGRTLVELVQKKTASRLYLPISAEALKQLPVDVSREGLVFPHLPDASYTQKLLNKWVQAAGLSKHITFHVARHTFATLSLTYGADLYTISKLLGHTNIRTTQIYADVISEKKRQAVDAIPPIGIP